MKSGGKMPYVLCGVDLPAWINAISVVALAAITCWYAYATHRLVGEVREERAERLRELRRPVATLLDEIESDLAASKAVLTATTFDADMVNISPSLRRSYERIGEVADLYRFHSERVHRELWRLRPAMMRLPDYVAEAVGDLRGNRDRRTNSERLGAELNSVIKIMDDTRRALNLVT
ncbi:MAG TPA: hypothetical protein VI670_25700 [Thermoanaerobaculia bacterium]|jgi:hypothetical protein